MKANDTLTLDFDNQEGFENHHYAFHVGDQDRGITYGSGSRDLNDMQINTRRGDRGFYFLDLDGHILELLTRT